MPENHQTPDRSTHKSVLKTHRTLVLGNDDLPIGWPRLFFTAQQTVTMLMLGRVEVSGDTDWWSDNYVMGPKRVFDDTSWWSDDYIMGVKEAYRLPRIVRIKDLNHKAFTDNTAAFNMYNLMLRDDSTCQYEGVEVFLKSKEIDSNATMDHVIPASRQAPKSWDNILLASHKANNEKKDQTPAEWGREPINWPYVPTNGEILYLAVKRTAVAGLTPVVVSLLNTIKPSSWLVDNRKADPIRLVAIAA